MSGKRPQKGRTRRASTDWGPWVYSPERGCYVTSRIDSRGEERTECSGPCGPPVAITEGLENGVNGISIADEPQPEGDGVAPQGGSMLPPLSNNETPQLQFPTSPVTSSVSSSYPQGQDPRYSSRSSMAQYENTTPNGSASTRYNYVNGRGKNQVVGWQTSTSYGAGNNATYATTPATSYNLMVPPPTGPANYQQRNQSGRRNSNNFNRSLVKAKDTRTEYTSKTGLREEFQKVHSSKFKSRHVFKVVWTEPSNGNGRGNHSVFTGVSEVKFGELAYTSIRRFVVCKNHAGHALCLPILTYGKRGTTKPGVKSAHHAIIFNESKSTTPPRSIRHPPCEAEGEPTLPNAPICVDMKSPRHQLDVMSRLNYAKVYTVEHNVKVCFIGKIHKKSVDDFKEAYARIQRGDDSPDGSVMEEMDEDDEGTRVYGEEEQEEEEEEEGEQEAKQEVEQEAEPYPEQYQEQYPEQYEEQMDVHPSNRHFEY
ncbi:hypothetical protein VE03_05881 [Pseudogymnoascus sp. 23342-1-I1]|nr:hypothetical protein VE03_05881 [Pseudogymnoascus sp. 23342-1-I1]